MKKYIVILFVLVLPVKNIGQEAKLSETIISIAEDLATEDTDPDAASRYSELLYDLYEDPVMVNSASEDELSRLFFLTDFQVKSLADYIHSSGSILSLFELTNIPGFDQGTAEMMIPFITLDLKPDTRLFSSHWRNTLITNLTIKPDKGDTISQGSQWRSLTKYKFIFGSFSGGFTAEKDPGEKILYGSPPLPDFLSTYLAYTGRGLIRKIIVGDYAARFGQGTSINSGNRTVLSITAPGYMSSRDEIKPYTSTDENIFFRGLATEFAIKNLEITLFYSRNRTDASVVLLPGSTDGYIKSFYKSGIHSTSSLLEKKDAVRETSAGANINYNFRNLRIGMTWANTRFSLPVKRDITDPETILNFQGDNNNIYTINYNTLIKKILLFGEMSLNNSNRYAIVQGLSLRPSDRLTINFLYRNYDAGYNSIHGKGPGNNSLTGNEHGILAGFTFEAAKHLFISAGTDICYFPWLKYRCSSPSMGTRREIRVQYIPSGKVTIEALYNSRLSETDNSESGGIPQLKTITGNTFKTSLSFTLQDNLRLTTRVGYREVAPTGSKGMVLSQDMVFKFRKIPLTVWMRYCIFNTESWDARLYIYENDLLYSFSIPALSGSGSRSYVMFKLDIGDFAELRIKYGITTLTDSSYISENKDELKLQMRMWF